MFQKRFERTSEQLDRQTRTEKFFVQDVMRLVSNKLPGFRESELRYLTFLYTCPLTTLFGMQNAGMPDRSHIKDAQSITIHLVGSRVAEFR